MFERYTESARRVILYARDEASQDSATTIEPEHLLLGVLREDSRIITPFLKKNPLEKFQILESIRIELEKQTSQIETAWPQVDPSLSIKAKQVLSYAAEESTKLRSYHIGPEHLLLGIMRAKTSFAARILREQGLTLEVVRLEIVKRHLPKLGKIGDLDGQLRDIFTVLEDLTHKMLAGVESGVELMFNQALANRQTGDEALLKLIILEDLVPPEMLKSVLQYQRKHGGRLEQILADKELLTSAQLEYLLSSRYKIPCLDLSQYQPIPETLLLIPKEVAHRYQVLPVSHNKGKLVLAMADPANQFVINEMSRITGLKIEPVISLPVEIAAAIEKYYPLIQQSTSDSQENRNSQGERDSTNGKEE